MFRVRGHSSGTSHHAVLCVRTPLNVSECKEITWTKEKEGRGGEGKGRGEGKCYMREGKGDWGYEERRRGQERRG